MRIAITGATGFIGRYFVSRLARAGHTLNCWYRPSSDRGGFDVPASALTWVPGDLGDPSAAADLVRGCDAIIHGALYRPGSGFIGNEGDLPKFLERNVLGTIRLIEAARAARVGRFVLISTCAVHDRILDDRPLDETHPLWSTSHYGAHKAALEAFVSSYGLGQGYPICALRPTGVYGLAHPPSRSKWFDLVASVARGEDVECHGAGKEVHADDVAKAAELLLNTPEERVAGQAFNCCDRSISRHEVATIAKELTGSQSRIEGEPKAPKHQIVTAKIQALGMTFGGRPLLIETIRRMIAAVSPSK